MKDQYFGDRTDYIKHGFLRILATAGFPLGLHWMWTQDDGSSDGGRISYLQDAAQWRHYDHELFDLIVRQLKKGERRLCILEAENVIKDAQHWFEIWTSDLDSRAENLATFLRRLQAGSLVFLDPDNGLSVASVAAGARNADKYVLVEEVGRIWNEGHSVMLYQHFPRVPRDAYLSRQFERLSPVLPGAEFAAIVLSHVAFLVALTKDHAERFKACSVVLSKRWRPHIRIAFQGSAGADVSQWQWIEDSDQVVLGLEHG